MKEMVEVGLRICADLERELGVSPRAVESSVGSEDNQWIEWISDEDKRGDLLFTANKKQK